MKKIIPNFIKPGKVNMIIDGSFGSTGKGLIASRIAMDNDCDIAISTLSPNSGHTFYKNNKKFVTRLFPVVGIINDTTKIHFASSAVLDLNLFFKEIEMFNIDINRISIDPNVAIISESDKLKELEKGGIEKIASTQSGTGSARASKILRTNILAKNIDQLNELIVLKPIDSYLDRGMRVMVETGQGIDLGLNHNQFYPYVSSKDVIPASILGDVGVHPSYMGNCMLTFRTYPIRVGNIMRDGVEVGNSGPCWSDQYEMKWTDLGISPEITSVTKRERRIMSFSERQYHNSIRLVKPTHIFLNFANYILPEHISMFNDLRPKPNFIGTGPRPQDVTKFKSFERII